MMGRIVLKRLRRGSNRQVHKCERHGRAVHVVAGCMAVCLRCAWEQRKALGKGARRR